MVRQVTLLHRTKATITITLIVFISMTVAQAFAQTAFTVTVTTDQQQYSPGQTVTISGKVSDPQNNPVVGAAVSIEVNEPPIYVQLVSSDQSGLYTNEFVLPPTFAPGQYTIFVTAHKGNYTAAQQTQFTVLQQTTVTTASSSISSVPSTTESPTSQVTTPPSKCFIATASFGSEMAPEVTLLRNFRDRKILQTSAGRSFMLVFNSFYYSFSPTIASQIAPNPALRNSMKVLLYPLILILTVSDRLFTALSFSGEIAVVTAGIFAALGIGIVYIAPIMFLTRKITRSMKIRPSPSMVAVTTAFCLAAVLGIATGETLSSPPLLIISSTETVLGFVALGGLAGIRIGQLVERLRLRR
jgi:hypothetical protein